MPFDHILYVVIVKVITCFFFTSDCFKSQYAFCLKLFLDNSELKKKFFLMKLRG